MKPAQSIDPIKSQIRNKLRRFRLDSILEVAMKLLHGEFDTPEQELQSLPWLMLLLVKWALEDKMVHSNVGKAITPEELVELQKLLWNSSGDARGANGLLTTNVVRYIRSIAYVQVQFQRSETIDFVRWPALIARLHPNHTLRKQFDAKFGLSPDDFLDMTLAVYARIMAGKEPLDEKFLSSMRVACGDKVDTLLGLLSRDVPALRALLGAEASQQRKTVAQEMLEFPVFKGFPLVRNPHGAYFTWHRKVFARAVDEFIHTHLSPEGSDYAQPYGEIFERYVVELAKATSLDALDEKTFWNIVGKDKHAVEIILRDGESNVFVEAKFGVYQDEYVTLDDTGYTKAKLTKLRDGVAKAADVSQRLSADARLAAFAARSEDFLLLVTNRHLHLPTGRQLETMSSEQFSTIDEGAKLVTTDKLPIENIFVLSLGEYESLMTVVAERKVALAHLLKELAFDFREPSTWRLDFSQMAAEKLHDKGLGIVTPQLLKAATDRAMSRLAAALNEPEPGSLF